MWGSETSVVVVDDDAGCRELHKVWLADTCVVDVVPDGERALASIDDSTELVLLDREMPGLSGIDVADRLRNRGYQGYIVMVSGVKPGFEVVDIPVDDYLVKPITQRELLRTIEQFRIRDDYQDQLRELFSLAAKKARLELEKTSSELAASERYEQLESVLEQRRDAVLQSFDKPDADWMATFETVVSPEHV